jgi:murein DD-endopeptidase MepM/ murein hydrolase activator NlpD
MGITSRYGHLAKILVDEGDLVTRDKVIGLLGNSGRSTGPHLHYEILYKGKQLNPMKFLRVGKNVLKQS